MKFLVVAPDGSQRILENHGQKPTWPILWEGGDELDRYPAETLVVKGLQSEGGEISVDTDKLKSMNDAKEKLKEQTVAQFARKLERAARLAKYDVASLPVNAALRELLSDLLAEVTEK